MLRKTYAALFLLVMALVLTGSAALAEPETPAEPVEMIGVDGYVLTCSWLLAEDVAWAENADTPEADLVFTVRLRADLTVPIFTMTMLQDQSDYVKVLADPQGNPVPVGFAMAETPVGLTAGEQQAFTWAQDEVHLLLRTLALLEAPAQEIVPEEDPYSQRVRIVTDRYELSYSDYFADKLLIMEENGTLVFRTMIGDTAYTVFTMQLDADTGNIVIRLEDQDGSPVAVSFTMASAPEELSGEARSSFYAAQGAVNDILASIALR